MFSRSGSGSTRTIIILAQASGQGLQLEKCAKEVFYVILVRGGGAERSRGMPARLPDEIARRVQSDGREVADRGAVWTYLTTDQPFEQWKREVSRRLPFAIAAYWGMGA